MDTFGGAAIAVLVVVALMAAAFAFGTENAKLQIQHECKSFGATVIKGEKFRCELVKV